MSTNESADFFGQIAYDDTEVPEGVPRDRWGRPLIIPEGGGEPVAYTRASTLSGYITNKHGLHVWRERHIAQGMGLREDLAAMAGALPPFESNPGAKPELDEIISQAFEASGGHAKANHGTAIHAHTDPFSASGPVPERMKADVRSYEEAMEATGTQVVASEVFVVNDELKVAGTVDGVYAIPALGVAAVGDKKTGRQNLHSTAVQVGVYANAVLYDPATGNRKSIAKAVEEALGADVYTPEFGLYIHVPKGEGTTTLHPLDLVRGYHMAKIAALEVREFQQDKGFVKADAVEYLTQQRNIQVMDMIGAATTMDELRAIYAQNAWRWSEKLDKVGAARMVEIGGPHA